MENNKVIAEFMGVKTITIDELKSTLKQNRENGFIQTPQAHVVDDLKYHTSWDWLMPVIHKCFDVAEDGQMSDIMHHLQVAEMGDTYDAVVEFIKDQNTIVIGSFDENGNLI